MSHKYIQAQMVKGQPSPLSENLKDQNFFSRKSIVLYSLSLVLDFLICQFEKFCDFVLGQFPLYSLVIPGGGGTSLWVRRGCAPVLGSFWPENSGIGVSFYWKISVIEVYFHSEFSGIGFTVTLKIL